MAAPVKVKPKPKVKAAPPKGAGSSSWTRQYNGLPVWAWVAIGGVSLAGLYVFISGYRKSAGAKPADPAAPIGGVGAYPPGAFGGSFGGMAPSLPGGTVTAPPVTPAGTPDAPTTSGWTATDLYRQAQGWPQPVPNQPYIPGSYYVSAGVPGVDAGSTFYPATAPRGSYQSGMVWDGVTQQWRWP